MVIGLPLPFSPAQAIVFHIEVPSVTGLPKPEVTYVTLAGLGLEEA